MEKRWVCGNTESHNVLFQNSKALLASGTVFYIQYRSHLKLIMTFKTCSYLLLLSYENGRVENDDVRVTAGKLGTFKVKLICCSNIWFIIFYIAEYLNDLDLKLVLQKILSWKHSFICKNYEMNAILIFIVYISYIAKVCVFIGNYGGNNNKKWKHLWPIMEIHKVIL